MKILSCEENQEGFTLFCCKFYLSLFNQVSCQSNVISTNCPFNQLSFNQVTFDQMSFDRLSGHDPISIPKKIYFQFETYKNNSI